MRVGRRRTSGPAGVGPSLGLSLAAETIAAAEVLDATRRRSELPARSDLPSELSPVSSASSLVDSRSLAAANDAPPPPTPPPPFGYEVTFSGHAHIALYAYNDLLLRSDGPHGVSLDSSSVNEQRTYLQVDGWPADGVDGLTERPPWRLYMYGASEHYSKLHLGHNVDTSPSGRFPELSACDVFRLEEGEALRHITLFRERTRPTEASPAPQAPAAAPKGSRVEASPVEASPIQCSQVQPSPVQSSHVESSQVRALPAREHKAVASAAVSTVVQRL